MGAWVSYGLGSENQNLPAFVVLISQANALNRDQPLFTRLWSNGFLPSKYQGVRFRASGDPVLFLANADGIDATLENFGVDAIVAPTNSPAWPTDLVNGDAFLFGSSGFAAVAGYPLVSVNAGYAFGLPIGITFMASAWSEPTLIKLASGFEAAVGGRRRPRFQQTLEFAVSRPASATAAERQSSGTPALKRAREHILAPRVWRPAGL